MPSATLYCRKLTYSLMAATGVCAVLLAIRVVLTGERTYAWLLFPNLALAWIPYVISSLMAAHFERKGARARVLVPAGAVWLLFFPNAPYILTDFVHLTYLGEPATVHYDILLNAAAALTGLFIGLTSLGHVHDIVNRAYGVAFGAITVGGVLLLGGFGIYLGRFFRWNSWDVLTHPARIVADLFGLFRDAGSLAFAIGYAVVVGAAYAVYCSSRCRSGSG